MTKSNTTALIAFLTAVLVAMAAVAVFKGGLYVGKHEGDTLHLMQIVFRMADGQTPHLDFMTPIGVLAFWPIAMLVKSGFGIGMAIIWSQVITALVFLPIVIWIGWTRLTPWIAALFGLFVMVLLLALVHGESQPAVSISMHYNRLAWAASFVAIVAATIPSKKSGTGTVDGLIVGAMVCVLVMIKMTYFVSFVLPILIALLMTGQRRAVVVAFISGLGIAGVITLVSGVDFWLAYAKDLLTVAGSTVRSAPGQPLTEIMGAPAYLGGTMAAFAGVIFLRQSKVIAGGLIIFTLIPGFAYVTYQNYGNDPQWLMLLAVLLLALRHEAEDVINGWGWNLRHAVGITAAMALAMGAPSFFNLAYSPFRHMAVNTENYAPVLPRGGVHTDLQSVDVRLNRVDARVALDGQVAGLERFADRDDPTEFMGETFETCSVELGLPRVMDTIARDIEDAGLSTGKSLFAADLFSSHWLFSDLEPMEKGAPWYYGGVPGLRDADYLLVPLCPVAQPPQAQILAMVEELVEIGKINAVTEIRRTELYVLYALDQ